MNTDSIAAEYAKLKELLKTTQTRVDRYKEMLMEKVEETGTPDEKGNIWLEGSEWVLKREKRVKKTFDADAAMAWAEELEDGDGIIVTITPEPYDAVDEDALAAWAFLHKDRASEVKAFYGEDITWAFAAPVRRDKIDY